MAEREGVVVLTLQLALDVLNYPEISCSVQRMISFIRFIFSFIFKTPTEETFLCQYNNKAIAFRQDNEIIIVLFFLSD